MTNDAVPELRERARAILRDHLVWENHACLPLRPDDTVFPPQIDRFRAVGADVVSVNVGYGAEDLDAHIRMIAAFRRWFGARSERYVLVRGLADIDAARRDGRLAITFDVEGMVPLDRGDHGLVQMFHDLGVRWMLVAYNRTNAAGGGCHEADDPGLSAHGRAVLAEMKRVGMVVCCSHTGHRTAIDVMAAADNPVIFSHSNPSALQDHPRNIPDDLIRACAETGGVVGVNGIGIFLGQANAATVSRHIDHVAQLVGPDHVGISLDYVFDRAEIDSLATRQPHTFAHPSYAGPIELVPPEAIPDIVAELLALGWNEGDVAKIVGGNWRRVAAAVWKDPA